MKKLICALALAATFFSGPADMHAQGSPQYNNATANPYGDATSLYGNAYPLTDETYNRCQYIVGTDAYDTLTMPAGYITHIYFRAATTPAGTPAFSNFRIGLKDTNVNAFAFDPAASAVNTQPWATGLTTVLSAASYTIDSPVVAGQWVKFTLTTPYYYNGTSNLVIELSHNGQFSNGFQISVPIANDYHHSREIYGSADSDTTAYKGIRNKLLVGFDVVTCSDTVILFNAPDVHLCNGDTYTFGSQEITSAGIYYDTTINVNGCNSVTRLNVIADSMATPVIINNNGTLGTTDNSYTFYQWLDGNKAPISGATGSGYQPVSNGNYYVAVTGPYGCTDTSAAYSYTVTSIQEPALFDGLQLFPNPAGNEVYLEIPRLKGTAYISITGVDGRECLRQTINISGSRLDLSSLSGGVYFIKITTGEGVATRKLIVK